LTVVVLLLALLLVLWSYEAWRHRRALRAIPVRIHVNGSRGKSSVTRLIAAALRQSGHRVVAKTTGSKARFIHADGTEEPVIRLGTPNICEQIDVLDRARREGAEIIVMECMAIRPDLQKVCEENIMHSTIGVITNIRPDHLDVMGPTIDDVAIALSSTIPRDGVVISPDARFASILRRAAEARGSKLILVDPIDLPAGAMDRFAYVEHEENVAASLAVTRMFEVPDEVALQGMYATIPDAGACTRWHLQHNGRSIEFLNVFAANDLESTVAIWHKLALQNAEPNTSVALLNLRGDRIDRSLQFAETIESGLHADYYVLVGDLPDSVLRRFQRQVPPERLVPMGRAEPETIFDRIAQLGENTARVGGIGNMGGLGHQILDFVSRGRSTT
jgi:poly-gamma-glutamate synthase PgsB/CapB